MFLPNIIRKYSYYIQININIKLKKIINIFVVKKIEKKKIKEQNE